MNHEFIKNTDEKEGPQLGMVVTANLSQDSYDKNFKVIDKLLDHQRSNQLYFILNPNEYYADLFYALTLTEGEYKKTKKDGIDYIVVGEKEFFCDEDFAGHEVVEDLSKEIKQNKWEHFASGSYNDVYEKKAPGTVPQYLLKIPKLANFFDPDKSLELSELHQLDHPEVAVEKWNKINHHLGKASVYPIGSTHMQGWQVPRLNIEQYSLKSFYGSKVYWKFLLEFFQQYNLLIWDPHSANIVKVNNQDCLIDMGSAISFSKDKAPNKVRDLKDCTLSIWPEHEKNFLLQNNFWINTPSTEYLSNLLWQFGEEGIQIDPKNLETMIAKASRGSETYFERLYDTFVNLQYETLDKKLNHYINLRANEDGSPKYKILWKFIYALLCLTIILLPLIPKFKEKAWGMREEKILKAKELKNDLKSPKTRLNAILFFDEQKAKFTPKRNLDHSEFSKIFKQ